MAIIYSYPALKDPLASDDLLLVSDMSKTGKPTRTISVEQLTSFVSKGYTVYTALLTQAGTAVPVATVLQNTTGGTFVWTRQSAGNYTVTASTALFTVNKTIVFGNYGNAGPGLTHDFDWNRTSDTTITLIVRADDKLVNGSFEIRIY